MGMPISRDSLLKYLQNDLAMPVDSVDDNTALFSDGFLDSFSVGDLLMFLEENGGFAVEPEEVIVENIDSINRILNYVERKCGVAVG